MHFDSAEAELVTPRPLLKPRAMMYRLQSDVKVVPYVERRRQLSICH